MTVDFLYQRLTDSIAHLEHFYPCEIHVGHHQLRNLISTKYDGKIFYVHNQDVYVLDLESQQRSILVTIPFEARCLAAQYGWVCVGGQDGGHCAFIYIGEDNASTVACHSLHTEALGTDIVNSFTIHKVRSQNDPSQDEVVAIASNNDRSVSIYSLTKQILLATREFPRSMNYATLSPDCRIMAAVGDENKVYFLECDLPVFSEIHENESAYDKAWRHLCAPVVPTVAMPQLPGDQGDFSFAVAFSQTGQLCAASSEAGIITIFDMEVIREGLDTPEDAILCAFRSSREGYYGYVRSMAFSPAPWDILAWCESFGTVGLADVRQNLVRRQHLNLVRDPKKTVQLRDVTPEAWKTLEAEDRQKRQHQQRTQALRGHPPIGARIFNHGRPESRMGHLPRLSDTFSDSERTILQALETPTGEQRAPAALPAPFSINYTSHPQVRQSTSSRANRDHDMQSLNPSSTILTRGPRRRSSVVLSESRAGQMLTVQDSSRAAMTASPAPIVEDTSVPPMSTNDLTPSAGSSSSQPLPYNIPPSDPWHVIEASLGSVRRNPQVTPTIGLSGLSQLDSAIQTERQLSNRLERQLEVERQLTLSLSLFLEARYDLLAEPQDSSTSAISPSRMRTLTDMWQRERTANQRRRQELEDEVRSNSRIITRLSVERNHLIEGYRTLSQTGQATSSRFHPSASLQDRMDYLVEDHRARRQRVEQLDHQVQEAQTRVNQALGYENEDDSNVHNESTDNDNDRNNDQEAEISDPMPNLAPGDFRRLVDLASTTTEESPQPDITNSAVPTFMRPQSSSTAQAPPSPSLPSSPARQQRQQQEQQQQQQQRRQSLTNVPIILSQAQIQAVTNEYTTTLRTVLGPSRPSSIPSTSELANRVSAADWQLGRWMLAREVASNPRWSASSLSRIHQLRLTRAAQEDIMTEAGIGTAGIGWNTTGTKLFVGSEQGIFEFGLDLRDRMQVPDLAFR